MSKFVISESGVESNTEENSITRAKNEISNQLKFFEATTDLENLEDYSLVRSEDIGFHFDSIKGTIEIPESRLESSDFEFGLAHELTEMLLRKLILPTVGISGNLFYLRYILHEATVLSLPKYSIVAQDFETLETNFEKASQENLKKLHASLKNPYPASDSKKEKES